MTPTHMAAKSVLGELATWLFSIRRRTWLIIAGIIGLKLFTE